jgi:hypothetical protein
MKDPKPENIRGTKQVVHKVEHRIDWGYVTLGIGVLVLAFVLYRLFSGGSPETEDDMEMFDQ